MTRPDPQSEPSAAQVEAYLLEEWKHERWGYWEDGLPRCDCGAPLEVSDEGPVSSLERHRVRVSLEAAMKVRDDRIN